MKFASRLNALTLATGAALLAAACAPPNPTLQAPPRAYSDAVQSTPVETKTEFRPKVDVLFVIDNSESMKQHQENLKKNIDRFVEAFEANKRLDFQIGVTTVFDSRRFDGVTVTADKFHPIGRLYPVKDPAAVAAANAQPANAPVDAQAANPAASADAIAAGALAADTPTFVTRGPNYAQILGETLKIGVVPRGTDKVDLGGPEFEELFSPVVAAIDGRNPGFIRPDAHLAIIMITDADDVSLNLSPSKLAGVVAALKDQDASMYSTYAVLSMSKGCPVDPGNRKDRNARILSFLEKSNPSDRDHSHAYDLCDPNYGDKLAEVGRMIDKNASHDMKIHLNSIPQAGTLRVVFAGTNQDVPHKYNSHTYTITVPASAMDKQSDDAEIQVNYTPVDPRSLNTPSTAPALNSSF